MGRTAPAAVAQNAQRVSDAYNVTLSLLEEHHEAAQKLLSDVLDGLDDELRANGRGADAAPVAREFLDDGMQAFRFYRRAGFDAPLARSMLYKTVQWRLEGGIDELARSLLLSPYMSGTSNQVPLFWQHSRFRDRLGRPGLYVRLQHVERTDDGLRELKAAVIAAFDMTRHYLQHIGRRTKRERPVVQAVLVVDVAEAGLANLELDLLPFFKDLLKNHYPGLVGAVYVVRYSWFHASLWRVVKPVLPPKLLERLFFVDDDELQAHFPHAVPRSLGGPLAVEIEPDTSDVFQRFSRPAYFLQGATPEASDAAPSPAESDAATSSRGAAPRWHDVGSMYDVLSRVGSPYRVRTPGASGWTTPQQRGGSTPLQLRDLPTSPAAYRRAPPTHARRSWWAWLAERFQRSEPAAEAPAVPRLVRSSADSPDLVPVDGDDPADMAEDASVTRYLTWRAHKYAEIEGHDAPYNIENPYFGYPAATARTAAAGAEVGRPVGLPHDLHVRRRKRDLVRTLTYLFALRLVNMYRMLRRHAMVIVWSVVGPPRTLAQRSSRRLWAARHSAFVLALLVYMQLYLAPMPRRWRAPLGR